MIEWRPPDGLVGDVAAVALAAAMVWKRTPGSATYRVVIALGSAGAGWWIGPEVAQIVGIEGARWTAFLGMVLIVPMADMLRGLLSDPKLFAELYHTLRRR